MQAADTGGTHASTRIRPSRENELSARDNVTSDVSGSELHDGRITVSPEGEATLQVMGFSDAPTGTWFYPTGTAGRDDFGLTLRGRLEHTRIEEYDPERHK